MRAVSHQTEHSQTGSKSSHTTLDEDHRLRDERDELKLEVLVKNTEIDAVEMKLPRKNETISIYLTKH